MANKFNSLCERVRDVRLHTGCSLEAIDIKQHLENLRRNAQRIVPLHVPLIGLPVDNSASNFTGAAITVHERNYERRYSRYILAQEYWSLISREGHTP